MHLETLYDYLKLLVPKDYTVTLKQDYISVTGYDNLLDSVSYTIKDNCIVLSTILFIPEYAKEIFGEPIHINPVVKVMLTEYYFKIPEDLEHEH